jgi:hypothetical protein
MRNRIAFWLALVSAAVTMVGSTYADPPVISDPDGRLIAGFNAPGEFPTSVTAANVNITPQAGAEFDGPGEDVLKVTFPAAGPIKWTSSRYNNGDPALLIGPAQPANSFSYPANAFVDNFQAMQNNGGLPIDPNSHDLTTLAWRVSNATGALFSAPRVNGVNDGYVTGGTPVAFSVAVSYLPYEQGWLGAWVNAAADGEATFASSSPDVLPSSVVWTSGVANVTLPGVNSATDGMLFVAPANGGSQTRIAAAFPNGSGGWTTTVRFDEDDDITGQTFLNSGNEFQFLYIPYTAANLIGGHVEGSNGSLISSADDEHFDIVRTSAGQYSLTVFEANGVTKKDESDGMLMLSVASNMPGAPTLADRTFLSYQFDAGSGNFVIQSRELLSTASATPDDAFGNDFQLRDSDFYFTWVDFANPLSLSPVGDFDGDGEVDAADLDVWQGAFGLTAAADADGDGDSDGNDFLLWQRNVGAGVAGAPASGAVPEPGAAILMVLSVAALTSRKRHNALADRALVSR